MATLLLSVAGGAIGGIFGPIGAMIGQAAGALVGGMVDQAIISSLTPGTRQEGPRLTSTDIQTSTEGSVIDRVIGRARIAGQVIWATRFEEQVVTETTGGKGAPKPKVTTTTYRYFGNFAVGLCEGPIAGVGRIWADGKEIDRTLFEHRCYGGSEVEPVDPLIEAKEGLAPAYRGLAYIVFERLPLEEWGNRIPQISAEVFRRVGDLEAIIPGVSLIGGNEFGYDTELVRQTGEDGGPDENRHTLVAATDFAASLDRLRMLAPNASAVMLVIPWMGDDLRCGSCTIRPKVDSHDKTTTLEWQVSDLTRPEAELVTMVGGKPAYGGSPNDASVIRAIRNLAARGYRVTICPFVMMDIATGNSLPNPWSAGGASPGQPAYPWRGRITCSPAPGFAGSVDKTAGAAAQVAAFVGSATPGHFSASGETVSYHGPAQWSYRRFFLHCAYLAKLAGGVSSFLIGSEMIGMSQVRSGPSTYPFVDALRVLAADVSGILGASVKVGYTADWTEFNNHRPADGSNDVFFNLDPLWSDPNIDFVGIDNYFPLSDWRDGSTHLDFHAINAPSIHHPAYLDANVEGGEYYDWYYADATARAMQARTPIADAYGKPWVFRQKDIRNWWANRHYNRPGGAEGGSPTGWVPQSKPIRFIEMGCPAVDKGSNQPNVFVDPKSSESFYPYFSNATRDDVMPRSYLEALIGHYGANNPVSPVYGGPMLDLSNSHVWTWDARPWPSFPQDGRWGDAVNWWQGHWLPGRIGNAPGREAIRQILADGAFSDYAIETMAVAVDGITSGSIGSARSMLEAIRPAFQFDAVESGGAVRFMARHARAPVAAIAGDDLVLDDSGRRFRQTRGQETDLPHAVKLRFGDPARDDQPAGTEARRAIGASIRTIDHALPVIMADAFAGVVAERELRAAWVGRERVEFSLPPSRLALDPGDVISFAATAQLMRLSDVSDGAARAVQAFRVDPAVSIPMEAGRTAAPSPPVTIYRPAEAIFIDGPLLRDDDVDRAAYVAASLAPFGSGVALYRSPDTSGFAFDSVLTVPGTIGVTTADLYPGPLHVFDQVNRLYVRMSQGSLYSIDDLQVLNGGNALLVENQDGEWELLQFGLAAPNGSKNWILSRLLRGQKGSEHAMRAPVPAGARVVLVDLALQQTALPAGLVGLPLNWRAGPADRDVGAAEFVQSTQTLRAKARRPLSPVHLRAARNEEGDFALRWIRRTRIAGDGWDQPDVPLGEDFERYDVEILDGATVIRTIAGLTSPACTYSAALQTSDFGGPQTELNWRVYQLSASFGRGIPGVYS